MRTNFSYKKALAAHLGAEISQLSLFWKGRIGLYGLLRNLDLKAGDEVIIPAFTCVVVANAIIYLGGRPVYVDIDPQTYNMDPEKVTACITARTRLIIAQNTFGLSSDIDALRTIAQQYDLGLIEDCTHGFGGRYRDQPNGTLTQAAFFSSQWNKTFSTGIGGIVYCRDAALADRMAAFEADLPTPGFGASAMLAAQLFIRRYLLSPALYWPMVRLYRWLSARNIITGSSGGQELEAPIMPPDYLQACSTVQARAGLRALSRLPENLQNRQDSAAIYDQLMAKLGRSPLFVPDYAHHTYIQYPLLVKDRDRFVALATQHRIPLNDWMNSPIHPVQTNWDRWGYTAGSCPEAERVSRHIVNLPTVGGTAEAKKVAAFIQQHREELYDVP